MEQNFLIFMNISNNSRKTENINMYINKLLNTFDIIMLT